MLMTSSAPGVGREGMPPRMRVDILVVFFNSKGKMVNLGVLEFQVDGLISNIYHYVSILDI